MDAIDRLILAELQLNAQTSNQDLADRIGLSPSPTLRRVRRLEVDGVISKYVAVVDPGSLGLGVMALVSLTLGSQDEDTVSSVEDHIRSLVEVTEAYTLAGEADYLLKVMVVSLEAYEHFVRTHLRTVTGIASITTMFAYATVKAPSPITPPLARD